ncbi:MAG: hypothetical protein GX998_05760 [Firmicutes bacterium]|nr:hypothetical protein [Bacillota bacterium]
MRFSLFAVLLVSALISLGAARVPLTLARGWTELEIEWVGDENRQGDSSMELLHSLGWQGQPGQLKVPVELGLRWSKNKGDGLSLQKGELILKPAQCELRIFHDMGFRSTLDPMRLLSSVRRADGAGGLELRGTVGPASLRGLWLDQIDNIGDNGPLLLLDMSLGMPGKLGKYRYIYLSHDSDWQWHFPQTGAYATRTARQTHSLMGTWHVMESFRAFTQIAVLSGVDVRKTFSRDIQGFGILSGAEGRLWDLNWSADVYRTNPGFILATGDGDSPGGGRQGVRARVTRSRHRDESLRLTVRHDTPIAEVAQIPTELPGYVLSTESMSELDVTYRRRKEKFSYRIGLAWEAGTQLKHSKIVWETNWIPNRLQIGGRFGGTSSPQLYSRFSLHALVRADVRWDPAEGWWRTAIHMQGLQSRWQKQAEWQGQAVYKKRPGEAYTYLALQHKMEKGYWEISWGKPDQGRLDWSWGKKPQMNIRVGRYF